MIKKLSLALIALALVTACTPHGKVTPFSKNTLFNFRSPIDLKEAKRQASIYKNAQKELSYYEVAYNKSPEDDEIALAYAQALRQAGFANRSIVVLEKHYRKWGGSQEIALEYIKAHISAGEFDEAKTLLKKRIAYDALNQQKDIKQEYLAAVREARIQKTIEPERPNFEAPQGDPEYHNLLGVIYDATGHSDKAEIELRNALDRWEGDPGVVENNLALALANQGKLEEAVRFISKAFVAAPDRPQVVRNLEIISALSK